MVGFNLYHGNDAVGYYPTMQTARNAVKRGEAESLQPNGLHSIVNDDGIVFKVFDLPTRKTTVELGADLRVKDIHEMTDSVFHLIACKIIIPELSSAINVTYDVMEDNLIIHRWYRIDDDRRRDKITESIRRYFKGCMI